MKKNNVFRFLRKPFLVLFLCITAARADADITLPAILSSNMVLQQNTRVILWGMSEPARQVTLMCSWDTLAVTSVCDSEGKWKCSILTPPAGGPYTITIADGDEEVVLDNVLTGEVWFCSGQSNMEFPLGVSDQYWHTGAIGYEKDIPEAIYPQIRLFTVAKKVAGEIEDDCRGEWLECSPEAVNMFSAVAYYFGRMVHRQLNVPVGLINSSWGGTPAESWTRKEVLESDTAYQWYFRKFQKYLDAYPEAYKKYTEALDKWRKGVETGTITGTDARRPPREPIGPGNCKTPVGLYNGMVAPVIPYTIRGVIWYQGESNADNPALYEKLFPDMIRNWRTDWGQGDFPFYYVQISAHYQQNPMIREAQRKTMQKVPNTGMVVCLDVSDSLDIHPQDKKTVGERLALWALSETYHMGEIVYSGPLYRNIRTEGSTVRVFFDHTGTGLEAKNGRLDLFEIAGEDGVFVPAQARIDHNEVVVSAEKVPHPVAVRYAWKNFMVPDLFNREGLPASSFSTNP